MIKQDSFYGNSEVHYHIWDSKDQPPDDNFLIILWSSSSSNTKRKFLSIPDIVDTNSDNLRNDYLAWIYKIGVTKLNGKKVLDRLKFDNNLSYWWVTSVAQKFNLSLTSGHNNAIKVLALERYLLKLGSCNSITLTSSNLNLEKCLKQFCELKGINFKFHKQTTLPFRSIRSSFELLPGILKGLTFLARYFFRTFFLEFSKLERQIKKSTNIIFFDILVHLNKNDSKNRFSSNYWTVLIGQLNQWGQASNWAHFFFSHKDISSPREASCFISSLNNECNKLQTHFLIEKRLTLSLYKKILSDFFKLRKLFLEVMAITNIKPDNYDINPWVFHKNAWSDSFLGLQAMDNCIKHTILSDFVSKIPKQNIGFYISENQPWELFLIHAWRTNKHGKLIGVPHTTVRFWDLRYHFDSRTFANKSLYNLPLPNNIAINGDNAKQSLLRSGCPKNLLIELEALRFIHLLKIKKHRDSKKEITVLVCGEFLFDETCKILNLVKEASHNINADIKYIFKPHPAFSFNLEKALDFQIEVSNELLSNLLPLTDVVITGNATTSAVEAFCYGLTVIQILSNDGINSSPFYPNKSVVCISNSEELVYALQNFRNKKHNNKSFFYLDQNLGRWKKIILGSNEIINLKGNSEPPLHLTVKKSF
ncbi:hypothetical protein EMGBS12_12480 [Methylophilaceae bacterium]|jgi:surface carbohydrate biosynthesis protein (TIGR04326 family)|nr:hypothetical protein EMGBS12_12480 [Methylophilaceae bacterium]